ncbi:MAG: amino acid transporter, partial [Chloroflexota bacterium]|nr:amino acid transporter [Chloroflexota bacterium]
LPGEELRPEREQLWVRRNARSPWIVDLLLTPSEGDDWCFKRDHSIRLPLTEIGTFGPDGVPYLRPEIILLHKARLHRPKDQADFKAILPRLGSSGREWLLGALARTHPDHSWLPLLTPDSRELPIKSGGRPEP